MKKLFLTLILITFGLFVSTSDAQALQIFSANASGVYDGVTNGGTEDLVARHDEIQNYNICVVDGKTDIGLGLDGGRYGYDNRRDCEDAGVGAKWFPFTYMDYYGTCRITSKVDCESYVGADGHNGIFYPALVKNYDGSTINVTSDLNINYILISYNQPITFKAKVTLVDKGAIATIGENGKIVVSDGGSLIKGGVNLIGNGSEYTYNIGTTESVTIRSLDASGNPFAAASYGTSDIPAFMAVKSSYSLNYAPSFTPAPTPSPSATPSANPVVSSSSSSSNHSSSHSDPQPATAPVCGNIKPASSPDLFQVDTSGTDAKLYFTPVQGFSNEYLISFGENSDAMAHSADVQLAAEGVQSYDIHYLLPNRTYYLKVAAKNGCAIGEWSNTMKIVAKKSNFYRY